MATEMTNTVTEIEHGSQAWWDLVASVELAQDLSKKLSISFDRNGKGEVMVAFKVGEGMWTAHRTVNR